MESPLLIAVPISPSSPTSLDESPPISALGVGCMSYLATTNATSDCTLCADGYQLESQGTIPNKYHICITNDAGGNTGCQTINTVTNTCKQCDPYYTKNVLNNCVECPWEPHYEDCVRCDTSNDCYVCNGGYYSVAGQCVQRCPDGQYPTATFDSRNYTATTQCESGCASLCRQCITSGSTYCTDCNTGYYLARQGSTSVKYQYGTCTAKSGSGSGDRIYVTGGQTIYDNDRYQLDGSTSDYTCTLSCPYYCYYTCETVFTPDMSYRYQPDIISAIAKAEELCATYSTCAITIYLLGGTTHYMLRDADSSSYLFQQANLDTWSGNLQLTIEGLSCTVDTFEYSSSSRFCVDTNGGQMVSVNYKMRDTFKFFVNGGLTIKFIQFNALDSIITPDTDTTSDKCLQSETQCCSYSSGSITPAGGFNCYVSIPLTEECSFQQGSPFIEFNIDPFNRTLLTAPPTLTIQNCQFEYFLYQFSSFIQLNNFGGFISIQNSSFNYFSSCGSFIKNSNDHYLKSITSLSSYQDYYGFRINQLQYDQFSKEIYNPYTQNPFTCSDPDCFSITLQDSSFSTFNFQTQTQDYVTKVDPTYGMQYRGVILSLDGFRGPVSILRNTFYNNTVGYTSCDSLGSQVQYGSSTTDNYPSYGTKSVMQIMSLISIVNYVYSFEMIQNTFNYNSATKSLVYLDFFNRTTYSAVILSNVFSYNGAYSEGGAIYLRARSLYGQTVLSTGSATDSPSSYQCGGYLFQNNTFKYTVGCPLYSGAVVTFICIDAAATPSDTVTDTYTVGSVSSSSTLQTAFQTAAQSITFQTIPFVYNSTTYSVPTNYLLFSGNTYYGNAAGNQMGVVNVVNAFKVKFDNEIFEKNGDSVCDSVNQLKTITQSTCAYFKFQSAIQGSTSPGYGTASQLMIAPIYINNAFDVDLYNVSFKQNWLLEVNYQFYTDRSQVLYLDNVYGNVNINLVSITKHIGQFNDFIITDLGMGTIVANSMSAYQQIASTYPLFRQSSSQFDLALYQFSISSTYFYTNSTYSYQPDSNWIFNFGSSSYTYTTPTLTLSATSFSDIQCYSCTIPLMHLQAQTLSFMGNSTSYNIFVNINDDTSLYNSDASLIEFPIQYPYTYNSATITCQITLDYVYVDSCYSYGEGGFANFYYQSISGEQAVTGAQIVVSNSIFQSMNTLSTLGGGVFMTNLETIQLTISSTTFSNITSYGMGGVIKANSIGTLTITNVSVNQVTISTGYHAAYEGVFLYMDNSDSIPLIVNISDSTIDCKNTTSLFPMSPTTTDYYSVFYVIKSGVDITLTSQSNNFKNCFTAASGGIFHLDPGSASVLFSDSLTSYSYISSSSYGGALYIQNAGQLDIPTTTFSDISSGSDGGAIYAYLTAASVNMTDVQAQVIEAGGQGGFMALVGTSGSQTYTVNVEGSTSTSCYFNSITSASNGGVFYMAMDLLDFNFIQAGSSVVQSTAGNGGFLYHYSASGSSVQTLVMSTSVINQATAYLEGGLIYSEVNSITQVFNSSTTLSNIVSEQSGGLLSSHSTTTVLDCESITIDGVKSVSANGGLFNIISPTSIQIYMFSTAVSTVQAGAGVNNTAILGGMAYVKSKSINITIDSCPNMDTISSAGYGGVFYIDGQASSLLMTLTSSVFTNIQAFNQGSFINVQGTNSVAVTMLIQDSDFYCDSVGMWSSNNYVYGAVILPDLLAQTSDIGGLFYFETNSQGTVTSTDNIYRSCYTTTTGGVFYMENNMNLVETGSQFREIASVNGSALFCQGCVATFTDSLLMDLLASYGGSIYMQDAAVVTVNNVNFTNGKAAWDGGAIYATVTNGVAVAASLTFSNCINPMNLYEAIEGNGGFFYIDNSDLTLVSSGCEWSNLRALIRGGLIYGPQLGSFSLQTCSLINITSGQEGSFFYSVSPSINFTISSCNIACKTTYSSSFVSEYLSTDSYDIGVAFYFDGAVAVNSHNNNFSNCYVANNGSIFALTSTTFTESNSIYYNNSALFGGVYYCTNCIMTISNTVFTNHSSLKGGLLFGQDYVKINIYNTTIINSNAITDGGAMYIVESTVQTGVSAYLDMVTINSSYAASAGGAFYISQSNFNLTLYDSSFNQISSSGNGGVIYTDNCQTLLIEDSTFYNFNSSERGSLLYSTATNIQITTTTSVFNCQASQLNYTTLVPNIEKQNSSVGAVFDVTSATNTIQSSLNQFENCYIGKDGGIFYLEQTSLNDISSNYTNISAIYGGIVYCYSCFTFSLDKSVMTHLYSYEGSVFYVTHNTYAATQATIEVIFNLITATDLQAFNDGGFGYIEKDFDTNAPYALSAAFTNLDLDSLSALYLGGFVYCNNSLADIVVDTSTFYDVSALDSLSGAGGVFELLNINTVTVSNSNFTLFTAAMYGSFLHSMTSAILLTISSNLFNGQNSKYFFNDPSVSTISNSGSNITSSMLGATAQSTDSSAIYFYSGGTVVSYNNTFKNCYFASQGAVFNFQSGQSKLTDTSSNYQGNAAYIGGIVYCDECTMSFVSVTMNSSWATQGGTIYMTHGATLSMSNSTLLYSQSIFEGGFIMVYEESAFALIGSIVFQECEFEHMWSGKEGGMLYISSSEIDKLTFYQSTVYNTSAVTSGGGVYIDDTFNGKVSVSDSSIKLVYASTLGGFFFSQSTNMSISLSSNVLMCSLTYNYTYITSVLNTDVQTYNQAGAIYIEGAYLVTSTSNEVSNCYVSEYGSMMYLVNVEVFTESQSTFYGGAAIQGGAIACDSCTMTLSGTSFQNFTAQNGGTLLLSNSANMEMTNTIIISSYSISQGGAIGIYQESLSSTSTSNIVKISLCQTLLTISSMDQGGFIFMSNEHTQLYIYQISITDINAVNSGGVVYIEQGEYLELKEVQLSNVYALEGAMLYSEAPDIDISISESYFICQNEFNQTAVDNAINVYDATNTTIIQPSTYLQYSIFYIASAASTVSDDNEYMNCFVNQDGGVFTLVSTNFFDTASTFSYNAAINGGAINCNECNMSLTGTQFNYNYGYMGGVIFLQKNAYLTALFTQFKSNTAYKEAGVIYATQLSYFSIETCQFYYNEAYQSSAIEIFGGSLFYNSTIDQTLFQENQAYNSYTIKMDQAYLTLNQVTMKDNIGYSRTKNIFTVFSNLYIYDSIFEYTAHNLSISSPGLNVFFGGFINLGVDSLAYIQSSLFINGEAYSGGAIYVSSETSLNVSNCNFSDNYARTTGGAIFSQQSFDLFIQNHSHFNNNQALVQGDHIYFTDAFSNQLNINATEFISPNASTSAIYAGNVELVVINNTHGHDIVNPNRSSTTTEGGFIQCSTCTQMVIAGSNFTNIQAATFGGVIYVSMLDSSKLANATEFPSIPTFAVYNTVFAYCVADVGGVIYNYNSDYFLISGSTFLNNLATQQIGDTTGLTGTAGCLYYYCNSDRQQCEFILTGNNLFANNYAQLQGGAIHWLLIQVVYDAATTTFRNNSALVYGDDVSCVAQRLVLIELNDYMENEYKCSNATLFIESINRQLDDSTQNFSQRSEVVSGQRSGGSLPATYLAVVDMFGRIISSNQDSKLTMYVDPEYLNDPYRTKYAPILQGTTIFYSINGTYNMSGTEFTGAPLSNYTILLLTDAIDYSIPSNEAYLVSQGIQQIDFSMTVDLRECMPGEMFSSSGQCEYCVAGTTFSLAPQTSPGSCIQCPVEQAICLGGNEIGPQPGYWRSNNMTDVFYKCFNKDACLGMVAPDYNELGDCATGYYGILCSECIVGYSRTSSMGDTFICKPCPSPVGNAIKLGLMLMGYVTLVILMVRSTLMGAKSKKNVTSIYLKIAMNHIQLLTLIQTLNFNFPTQITSFFSSAGSATSAINPAPQLLSLDCYLDTRTSDNSTMAIPMYYEKMIMVTLLPILVSIIIFIVWSALKCYYERQRVKKLGQAWAKQVKQLNYLEQHGDKTEKDIASHQKEALLNQTHYPILGRIISTQIILLFFLHPTIVQFAITDFSCETIDSVSLLKSDVNIACTSSLHQFYTYLLALPCIIAWGLGIPFFALIMLIKNKNVLNKIETKEKLGFLYNGYKREMFFWEIVIMYRKVIVIFIGVFLESYGVVGQALVVFAILILFLGLSIQFRPFTIDGLNDLETLSLITQIITIYCGFFYITNVSEILSSDQSLSTSTKEYIAQVGIELSSQVSMLLFFVIMFVNAMFFIYWGLKMLIEVKFMIIAKVPKLYVCLFLCNDYERFKSQQKKQQLRETNEQLRDEYERSKLFGFMGVVLKKLLGLNDTGRLVLTDNVLERINVYLNEQKFLEEIGYLKNDKLKPRGKWIGVDSCIEQKRIEREKGNLDKKNRFLNMVHPEKAADTAMYKDYDKDDMLKIDQDMLEDGQVENTQNSIVEETKEPMNMNTGDNEPGIWSDDNMMKSDDKKLEGNLKFGRTVRNTRGTKAQWELDYMRKRRGSLNEHEMEDELWGDNTKEELFKKKGKKEKGEENPNAKMRNNFIIPVDFDQDQFKEMTKDKEGLQDGEVHNYKFLEALDQELDVRQIVQENSGVKSKSAHERVKQKEKEMKRNMKEEMVKGVRQKEKIIEEEQKQKEVQRKIDEKLIIQDLEKSFNTSDGEESAAQKRQGEDSFDDGESGDSSPEKKKIVNKKRS